MNRKLSWIRENRAAGLVLYFAAVCILVPLLILPVWIFFGRWQWPELFPSAFSLRALRMIFSDVGILKVIFSSILLSGCVAVLATVTGIMAARAIVLHDFRGKRLVTFFSMLPMIVPAASFAMGVHVVFLRMGLGDTWTGLLLVHMIYSVPYTVSIMTDITAMAGDRLELQAQVLGVSPLRAFWHISLPIMMPGVLSSLSMAYIVSFSQYFLTLLIGGGRVRTLSVVMVPYIQSGDRTVASAYATLFIMTLMIVFGVMEFFARRKYEQAFAD
ncbi:ABC transporter permease [Proteocatella sphenisci]|uniref:ABC transporter permease n=1 Tax=Proteocatella sphenisci TaxID=181070 RepID=UPI000490A972|nr:ABC transporter permease subunit [Proteocatella sphenisci]